MNNMQVVMKLKITPIIKFTISLTIMMLASTSWADSKTDTKPSEAKPKGPDWLVVATPTYGILKNTTTFHFNVPQGSTGEVEYEEHEATLVDKGRGEGFTLVGFYKHISLTNVFFFFPSVNSSRLTGNITHIATSIPTGTFVEPYIGAGFVVINTDTDYNNFKYTLRKDMGGRPAVGYASFDKISVDNRVLAPYPKIGAKFKIPIQHWYVTPFYSYMFEDVKTRARSPGGHVKVYDEGDKELGLSPQLEVDVPSFDSNLQKQYHSHLVGADFFVDFHYFLQMRGKVYYNMNNDLWTVRLIGSMLFNPYVGISAYFEYTEKITVSNTYFMIGPAFVFSPTGYFDKMKHRRKKKK